MGWQLTKWFLWFIFKVIFTWLGTALIMWLLSGVVEGIGFVALLVISILTTGFIDLFRLGWKRLLANEQQG